MDDIFVYIFYVCIGFVYIIKMCVFYIFIIRWFNNWYWILVYYIKYFSYLKLEGKIWKKKLICFIDIFFFLLNILNFFGNVSYVKFYFKMCKYLKVINNI